MSTIYFTEDHEWIAVEGDVATVGITNHAQEQLGDLVYVELPQPGRSIDKGEAVAVVESVKAASDVYAPVSGKVMESNGELAGEPGLVNREAEAAGWLFKVQLSDQGQLQGLMDRAAYEAMVG
jgi:glycine cleavage system H protein